MFKILPILLTSFIIMLIASPIHAAWQVPDEILANESVVQAYTNSEANITVSVSAQLDDTQPSEKRVLLAQYGLGTTAGRAGLVSFGSSVPERIGLVLFAILGLIGVIFLVMTIYGGFLWLTAGGNAEQVKHAGSMIKNGIIGVIIILASYAITLFVFTNLLKPTGGNTPTPIPTNIPDGTVPRCGVCLETKDCIDASPPGNMNCINGKCRQFANEFCS